MLGCSPPVHCIYPHQGCRFYRQGECVCGTGEGKIPELLHKAIVEEGYTGFLTLERIWCVFDSLQTP